MHILVHIPYFSAELHEVSGPTDDITRYYIEFAMCNRSPVLEMLSVSFEDGVGPEGYVALLENKGRLSWLLD